MANSIWITGDCHGKVGRFSTDIFPEQKTMDKSDVVEILGDFGLVWEQEESKNEKHWLDWLNEKPFTVVATLGNHENYDRIEKLPVVEKFGGPVWQVRESVFLLQSGYVYNINDKKVFNFNGAQSHDIQDGILDSSDPLWKKKARVLEKNGHDMYRVKGLSWWPQEIEQDEKVYERGLKNLEKNDWKVDFIWTHCCAAGTLKILGYYEEDRLVRYLEEVHDKTKFDYWFFGHYHEDDTVLPHEYCLYYQLIQIA